MRVWGGHSGLRQGGAGGRGWRGEKTCPISAPLPDLTLVLPFSSPCLLSALLSRL